MSSSETKLRNVIASLDDSALEALANKGLLRRAYKDLERGLAIELKAPQEGAVFFKVDQFDVSIPDAGPAKATCSCPSPGICQHILAAVLFLKRDASTDEATQGNTSVVASAEQELLSFSREQLETFAGKATFRSALQLALQATAEITTDAGIVVHIPALNIQCHYVPRGGLDGMIVSGSNKDKARIAVAAVIAFQRSKGMTWESPAESTSALESSAGAPRSRDEVLNAALQLLKEMLDVGLARVSQTFQQRLATLAVSATGVNLPRLSLSLRGLSDECALAAARDARSDTGRMLGRMANTYALCIALQKGGSDLRPDLIGWNRTRYDEIGHLDLLGVAAWPWRTASGYSGLTVLFWDTLGKCWNSWSESRPSHQAEGFDPVTRYTQTSPWEGADSPRQLASSSLRLMNARRNPMNRLSASSKSRALVTKPTRLQQHSVPVICEWTQLSALLQKQTVLGLKESNPLDSFVAVKPTLWGQRVYNSVAQMFSWLLFDAQQQPLLLQMTFDRFTAPAMKYLESIEPSSLAEAVIIGKTQRSANGLTLFPYAIHHANGGITQLMLDTIAPTATNKQTPVAETNDEEPEPEEDNELVTANNNIGRLVDEVDQSLLIIAEGGLSGLHPARMQMFIEIAPRVERLNLEVLALALKTIISRPDASTLLSCCYLAGLHRAASAA